MALPDNYRKSVTEKESCGVCLYLGPRNHCRKWDATVQKNYTCNAFRPRVVTVSVARP